MLVREVARSPQLGREVDEIEHAFAALERIVVRGQERGELRPSSTRASPRWILYGALEEILTGWVFERLPGGTEDVARAEQTVVELLDGRPRGGLTRQSVSIDSSVNCKEYIAVV